MPPKSKKQGRFMQAVANNPKFAKKVGVKQSIGREFTQEKDMKKVKKMQMGGRAMADRAGAQAMDPRMAMAMEDQRRRAAAGGMKKGGKLKRKKMTEESGQPKKLKRGGNTSRTNELEELGRVDAERGYSTKGKRNLRDEKARVVREIKNKKGYARGGAVADKEGRALAKNKRGMSAAKMVDAAGRALARYSPSVHPAAVVGAAAKAAARAKDKSSKRAKPMMPSKRAKPMMPSKPDKPMKRQRSKARLDESLGMRRGKEAGKSQSYKSRRDESRAMKTGGMLARTGGSSAKMKAKGKAMKKGGIVKSSASKRADGIAQQGHTRGRHV